MLKSATKLGKEFGLTGTEMNQLLKSKGLLSGEPNNWSITGEGKAYVDQDLFRRGTGGYPSYNPEWLETRWDESVLDIMNITDEDIQAAKAASAEARLNAKVREEEKKLAYDRQQQERLASKTKGPDALGTMATISAVTGLCYGIYYLWDNRHDIKLRWWDFRDRFLR